MQDDPIGREKLLRARAEIQEILNRYDIAGLVVLHAAPTCSEVICHLEPSYSVIRVDKITGAWRLKSKLADYNGNADAQRYDLEATANMASSMFMLAGQSAMNIGEISEVVDRETGAGHTIIRQVKPN